jgi:hypothetical protein
MRHSIHLANRAEGEILGQILRHPKNVGSEEKAPMATFTDVSATLSPHEHDRELRRAIIAATVGTTIEWYDFLLYSTMAGLVFGELFSQTTTH